MIEIVKVGVFDGTSDELVRVFINRKIDRATREKAANDLYCRHRGFVAWEVSKYIGNPADVEDVAQSVWMLTLQPRMLREKYTKSDGKFRAFLRNPISWSVKDHFKAFHKTTVSGNEVVFEEIDEKTMSKRMETVLYQDTIEALIKPFLRTLQLKERTAFVASEYRMMFEDDATVSEISLINGMPEKEVLGILKRTKRRKSSEVSDTEMSVYLPGNYNRLVDDVELKRNRIKHLASVMCVDEPAFRANLYRGRKTVIEFVRRKLDGMDIGSSDHG